MSDFKKPEPSYRFTQVNMGDDLRSIALRELGSAEFWPELAALNGLKPPYISESGGPGVLQPGDTIKIPAPGAPSFRSDDAIFGRDLTIGADGDLVADGGDLVLNGGIHNLSASLARRVKVSKGELSFHPAYGCHVRELLGDRGPSLARLAAFYVASSLREDYRVEEVVDCRASVAGDSLHVEATARAISGLNIDLSVVL